MSTLNEFIGPMCSSSVVFVDITGLACPLLVPYSGSSVGHAQADQKSLLAHILLMCVC